MGKPLFAILLLSLVFGCKRAHPPAAQSASSGVSDAVSSAAPSVIPAPSASASAANKERTRLGSYSLLARVVAPKPGFYDDFGAAVAVDGDYLAIGAPGRHEPRVGVGLVYIYKREGQGYRFLQTLRNPRHCAGSGGQLAFFGGQLLVSRKFPQQKEFPMWFERKGDAFEPGEVLEQPKGKDLEHFGATLAVRGNQIAIAARGTYFVPGIVFLYEGQPFSLKISAEFDGKPYTIGDEANFYIGDAIAMDGQRIVLGTTLDPGVCIIIYRNADSAWKREQIIESPFDSLGISGDTLLVGSLKAESPVQVYRFDGQRWALSQKLERSSGVAADGEIAVLTSGSVLRWDGSKYSEIQKLTGENGRKLSGRGPVWMGPKQLVIGQPTEGGKGAVYVYEARD